MDMIQQDHIGIGIGIGMIHSDHIGIGMVVSVEPYWLALLSLTYQAWTQAGQTGQPGHSSQTLKLSQQC